MVADILTKPLARERDNSLWTRNENCQIYKHCRKVVVLIFLIIADNLFRKWTHHTSDTFFRIFNFFSYSSPCAIGALVNFKPVFFKIEELFKTSIVRLNHRRWTGVHAIFDYISRFTWSSRNFGVTLLFLQGSNKLFWCGKNTHALRIASLIELLLNFRKPKQHNYCTCLMLLVVSEDVQGRRTFNFSGRSFNAFWPFYAVV